MSIYEKITFWINVTITIICGYLIHPGVSNKHIKKSPTIQIDSLKTKYNK